VTRWWRVAPLGVVLVAALVACGDDADMAEQVDEDEVASPTSLQDCAEQLGLDPDDYEDFTEVTDTTDPDNFIGEFEDFSDQHPDELAELEEEFGDEYGEDFATFTGAFTDEFEDDFDEATDVDSTNEVVINTDDYTDLFVDFDDCAAFVRQQHAAAVLDQVDEGDEIITGDGTGSGTGG
jgi:hypothetical protein